MTRPLYRDLPAPQGPGNGHKGLWYERFFDRFDQRWQVSKPTDAHDPKRDWIGTVTGSCGDTALLKRAAIERLQLGQARDGESRIYKTDWHFVTGLGLPHPVENGFAWHPTLGVPYLAGAAVKGLVRSWVEVWDEHLNDEDRKKRLKLWFGTESKDEVPEQAGCLIFFAAIPTKPPQLAVDVMTPHMGEWYAKGSEDPLNPEVTPADWHDPVPVPFLVVRQSCLLFTIAPRTKALKSEVGHAFEALEGALDWLGAGAKTAVGYGRMRLDDNELKMIQTAAEEATKARDARDETEDQAQVLASMGPLGPQMYEETQKNKGQTDYLVLLNALKAGRWKGDDACEIARYIKQRMLASKVWKETSQARRPEKDKDYQRTLEVKRFLEGHS